MLTGAGAERNGRGCCLTTETVQGSALSLQGVHHVQGGHGLSLGVLRVGDGVSDDVLQEGLQDGSDFLVDQGRDSLDTTSSGQSSDGRLGDTLDVISENLSVSLGTALS